MRIFILFIFTVFIVGCEKSVETAYIPVFSGTKVKMIERLKTYPGIESYKFVSFTNVPESHSYLIGFLEVKASLTFDQDSPPRRYLDGYANTVLGEYFPERSVFWYRKLNPNIYQSLAKELKTLEQESNPKHILVTDEKISIYYK